MKKTKLFLAGLLLTVGATNLNAQQWGSGSGIDTWTSGTLGVGTPLSLSADPTDAWQHIYGEPASVPGTCLTVGGSYPTTVTGYAYPELFIERQSICGGPSFCGPDVVPNFFQVGYTGCGGPMPYPAALLDVINYQGYLGVLTDHPSEALEVNGNTLIDQNLTVDKNATILKNESVGIDLTVGHNATIDNDLYVRGGLIDMTVPGDGIGRTINANSSNTGLNLNSGTHGASIGMNAGYGTDRPGCIGMVTTGPLINPVGSPQGPTGYMFYWYGSSSGGPETWHNLVHFWNDGKVTIGENIDDWWENQYGYTPDGYKLFVSGGILTEKLKVAIAGTPYWSDYVFNSDYKLMSLNNVESYIKTNKHLPDVPSAEEVVKSGIDVATMDAKLLQKIEELTLYTIQLQKQVNEQGKEIQTLRKEKIQ